MEEVENIEAIKKKIDEVNELIWKQRGTPNMTYNPKESLEDALTNSKAINYTYGIARCRLNLGMGAFIIDHNVELSLKLLAEAHDIFQEIKNKKWIANALLTLAIIKNSTGNPESALYSAIKGIEFYEQNQEDIQDVSMAYYVIGTVYKDLKQFDKAEAHYKKGIEKHEEKNSWVARIYTGLSNIYNIRGQDEEALKLSLLSLEILREEQNKIGESRALNDIGIIYRKLKKYNDALDYFFQGLKLREETHVLHFILGSLIEIADTYLEIDDKQKALNYFLLAEPIAIETKHSTRLASIYQNIANLYKLIEQYSNSILYFEKLIILNQEIDLKERESKILNLQNTLLQEKEEEIERLKNIELKNAYELISEKNKEITDSIHYAKRIQNALLASDDLLKNNLKEHFVFFNPKDIVSGDFYWATKKDNRFYLAVCDSTGHGVPGAFMSLLNITFLNEAISEKNIKEPHLIFNYVRDRLITTISQDGAQDGMDGIILCIDENAKQVSYAAANNAPVAIYNNKILDLTADKMPIGKGQNTNSFTLNTIPINESDMIYLITDGFADQFGGPKGKKFMHKHLLELFLSQSKKTLTEQKNNLELSFNNWKGELEQVDDVCIIGIRL